MAGLKLDRNRNGNAVFGNCDLVEIAEKYQTPVYVMDEQIVRDNCRTYVEAFNNFYHANGQVLYASKALSCKYIYKIMQQQNMGIDVVSGGELYTALKADFPVDRIYFHGNNKSLDEIKLAIASNVWCIVVDNLDELYRIDQVAARAKKIVNISFRIKPGIEAHTHEYIKTGQIDSKFGVAIAGGEAKEIIKCASTMSNLKIIGVHCHIGSQIFEISPFVLAAETMLNFIADIYEKCKIEIKELNLGGGFGIKYTEEDNPPEYTKYIETVAQLVSDVCAKRKINKPKIVIEPGRSIVATAGITLYTVGSIKRIPNVRTYVLVDGGMTDNPRYCLYNSKYSAVKINAHFEGSKDDIETDFVTIAGKCCESGDILIKDIKMPRLAPGDLIGVLNTGAYNYSMASNYNRYPRPPIVVCSNGTHKLIVKRESYDDIIKNDCL